MSWRILGSTRAPEGAAVEAAEAAEAASAAAAALAAAALAAAASPGWEATETEGRAEGAAFFAECFVSSCCVRFRGLWRESAGANQGRRGSEKREARSEKRERRPPCLFFALSRSLAAPRPCRFFGLSFSAFSIISKEHFSSSHQRAGKACKSRRCPPFLYD